MFSEKKAGFLIGELVTRYGDREEELEEAILNFDAARVTHMISPRGEEMRGGK